MKNWIVTLFTLCMAVALMPVFALAAAAPPTMKQAEEFIEANMCKEAVEILDQIIKKDPKNAKAHYLNGYCQEKLPEQIGFFYVDRNAQASARWDSATNLILKGAGNFEAALKYASPRSLSYMSRAIYEANNKKPGTAKSVANQIYSRAMAIEKENDGSWRDFAAFAAGLDSSVADRACDHVIAQGKTALKEKKEDKVYSSYYLGGQFCRNQSKRASMGEDLLAIAKGKNNYSERDNFRSKALNFLPESKVEQVLPFMEMVSIPAGCFQMGDSFGDGIEKREKPVHEVCVSAFSMGKYEVTNAQYRMYKPDHDSSKFNDYSLNGDSQPVIKVSWEDATAYAVWLSKRTGKKYRLPTEAEWEYAARGGKGGRNYWGDGKDDACGYANGHDITSKRAFSNFTNENHVCEDGFAVSAPVGSLKPNAFGLHDMMGNVFEWCSDWYGENYYGESLRNDPQGPSFGSLRVNRGSCWQHGPDVIRASMRLGDEPDYRSVALGFRLVSIP